MGWGGGSLLVSEMLVSLTQPYSAVACPLCLGHWLSLTSRVSWSLGSHRPEIHMLVDQFSVQVTSTWWGSRHLPNSSKDMAKAVVCRP